ncbi:alginate export family protein [Pseudomonas sp.]|uniref:alginate export family protein n=1 Tax=Pseudomonas sp. TaxID=306 RepID=UPI002731A151|nr:alginate export family protein [Pseudomonas sp.]MDP2242822.1 alginate export family protein [Pseudomonas sp.]
MTHPSHWLRRAPWLLALLAGHVVAADQEGALSEPASLPTPAVAAAMPSPVELNHKLTLQGGYGPENSQLGNDRKGFYGLRYEPSLSWRSSEPQWPKWQAFSRAWFNYNSASQASTGLQQENSPQIEYFSAELREFYLRRNLLGDDPRLSLSLGRQRYADHFGIWWDTSLESLRLNFDDTFARGFVAVGQKLHTYNSDSKALDARERDIAYAMGEYALRWSGENWAGLRLLLEQDYSGRAADDPSDFKGGRVGLFFHGDDLHGTPLLSDYRLELALLDGSVELAGGEKQDRNGWALLGELGKHFTERPWSPRLALYGGITDKPDDSNDGFYLNAIQSDRVANPETYSNGLVSAFIGVDLRNLAYYGIALETRPQPRHFLDLRLTDLHLRDADGDLPINLAEPAERNGSRALGQTLDLNYYWELFPYAVQDKHVQINALLTASYFRAGDAIGNLDNDFQVSFGVVLRY